MESLRSYILESKFIPAAMAKALFGVLPLVEATNINKDFLVKEAGSPEALATAKQSVNTMWAHDEMDGVVRNQNVRQKVLNILYLMEIRKPGFVNHEILKGIHDLAIHNSLEQRFLSKVNSDTLPEQAVELLTDANRAVVQSAKAYPDLTQEEEAVWNRVKVYHEFPDGFRWVYAVDPSGRIATHMPSTITAKTMHHCGNQPSATSDNQYWELRDATGKAYLTVILNGEGGIEESKSWGNQPNKHRQQILPYVKWFLMDRKVTGVGRRYDYGYSTHTNFGVKDFIGEDNEFVDYVLENKPALLGNTEKRTLFWKNAIDDGIITVDMVKKLYADQCTMDDLAERIPGIEEYQKNSRFQLPEDYSLFGKNPFEVVCAACGSCPYDEAELEDLIKKGIVSLAEFANYDIKLLTPEIQKAFVQAKPTGYRNNLDTLMNIATEVASFSVADEAIFGLVDGDDRQWDRFFNYMVKANPPSKVSGMVHRTFADDAMMEQLREDIVNGYETDSDVYIPSYTVVKCVIETLSRFEDIEVPRWLPGILAKEFSDEASNSLYFDETVVPLNGMDDRRLAVLVADIQVADVAAILDRVSEDFDRLSTLARLAVRCGWGDLLEPIIASQDIAPETVVAYTEATGKGLDRCKEVIMDVVGRGNYNPESPGWHKEIIELDAFAHGLCLCPEVLGEIDWTRDRLTADGVSKVVAAMQSTQLSSDAVDRVVRYVVRAGIDLFSGKDVTERLARVWVSTESYGNTLVNSLVSLVDNFSLDVTQYSNDVTLIVERWMGVMDNGMRGPTPYLTGQGTLVNFPMDRWQELSERYGTTFLSGYVLSGGAGRGLPPETTWPALLDILQTMPEATQDDLLYEIMAMRRFPNIPALVREMGDRIADGRLTLTITQLGVLLKKQMLPAKTLRAILKKQEENGVPDITSEAGFKGLISSFHKMMKVDALPKLVNSAIRTAVDYLYENLGLDARLGWKGENSMYCWYMNPLFSKITSRLDKYCVAKAFLEVANDQELLNRLRGYKKANRDAVGDREPKWSCDAEREVDRLLNTLANDGYRAQAEHTVRDNAPKTKATRTRKPKQVPSVA